MPGPEDFFRVSLPRSATLADLRPLVRGHSPYESAGKDSLMCKHNRNLSSSDSLPRSATLADLCPLVRGHSPYESAGKDSLMCEHNGNLSSSDSHCSLLSRLFSLVKILCLLPAHLCS